MNPAQGGVVEAINQAALVFNSGKNQMSVLCLDEPDSPWVLECDHYKIHAIGEGKTAYGFHFGYLSWIWKNSSNYDVVIIDGLWQFLVFGGYILKLMKVPYCVFVHGMLDPYFNNDKLKYIKKLPFWFLSERNVIALAGATVFTCKEESILAENSLPFYRANAVVSTLGVEEVIKDSEELINKFTSKFYCLKNKRFALFLSRIHEKKGIDMLIDALGDIDELPADFMLAIAGPDSNGLQAELTDHIKSLGLTDRIVWLGMLSGDIKWGAYHAADVFVLPSHQENFGIVVAEALSTATSVLITNKVNIWREIYAAGAGIVENDDVEGVKNLLYKWFRLTDIEKNTMHANAKICHKIYFSIESAASDLEGILSNVLQVSKASKSVRS